MNHHLCEDLRPPLSAKQFCWLHVLLGETVQQCTLGQPEMANDLALAIQKVVVLTTLDQLVWKLVLFSFTCVLSLCLPYGIYCMCETMLDGAKEVVKQSVFNGFVNVCQESLNIYSLGFIHCFKKVMQVHFWTHFENKNGNFKSWFYSRRLYVYYFFSQACQFFICLFRLISILFCGINWAIQIFDLIYCLLINVNSIASLLV